MNIYADEWTPKPKKINPNHCKSSIHCMVHTPNSGWVQAADTEPCRTENPHKHIHPESIQRKCSTYTDCCQHYSKWTTSHTQRAWICSRCTNTMRQPYRPYSCTMHTHTHMKLYSHRIPPLQHRPIILYIFRMARIRVHFVVYAPSILAGVFMYIQLYAGSMHCSQHTQLDRAPTKGE